MRGNLKRINVYLPHYKLNYKINENLNVFLPLHGKMFSFHIFPNLGTNY